MNESTSKFLGVVVSVMGFVVLVTSHSWWGLRGIVYVGYGTYMIVRKQK